MLGLCDQWARGFHLLPIYVYICHRHKNRFGKDTMKKQTSKLNGYLVWTLADMQMNLGSSCAHAQWFSHSNRRADDHDITR